MASLKGMVRGRFHPMANPISPMVSLTTRQDKIMGKASMAKGPVRNSKDTQTLLCWAVLLAVQLLGVLGDTLQAIIMATIIRLTDM